MGDGDDTGLPAAQPADQPGVFVCEPVCAPCTFGGLPSPVPCALAGWVSLLDGSGGQDRAPPPSRPPS